ncbi:MAG: FAD-dependent oxidoreductase [Ferruginibacter sp.]|nr:FAD-dependent oxidoreductase [Cytophagales bacterium]
MKHIVIVGNGISGITTARHVRRLSDHRITVISAESDHFFSRTALMYIYMGHLTYHHTKPYEDWFWEKNRIELKRAFVTGVDAAAKKLVFDDASTLDYDALVLAVGSKSNQFGWPGQDLKGVQGLVSLQDVERMETYTQGIGRAVVVGGGLIGIEMTEMLLSRKIPVTLLVREKNFWGSVLPPQEARMINRHARAHHVDLRLETELKEILPDAEGRVRGVVTTAGEEIPGQFVGLAVGVSPNVDFLKTSAVELGKGILVNEYFETNLPDVYATGDCVEYRNPPVGRKKIEQIWYTGRIHGETLAQTLCGNRTAYQPGVFFNSAKFFDIEYQTYGTVNNQLSEGEETFYWEHPDGKICLRINYAREGRAVTGVNVFGMRLRHAVVERWIREKQPLEHALERLPEANFDPEFFKRHEPAILQQYNQEQPTRPLASKARKGLFKRVFG